MKNLWFQLDSVTFRWNICWFHLAIIVQARKVPIIVIDIFFAVKFLIPLQIQKSGLYKYSKLQLNPKTNDLNLFHVMLIDKIKCELQNSWICSSLGLESGFCLKILMTTPLKSRKKKITIQIQIKECRSTNDFLDFLPFFLFFLDLGFYTWGDETP